MRARARARKLAHTFIGYTSHRSSTDYRNKVALSANIIARHYDISSWINALKATFGVLIFVRQNISHWEKASNVHAQVCVCTCISPFLAAQLSGSVALSKNTVAPFDSILLWALMRLSLFLCLFCILLIFFFIFLYSLSNFKFQIFNLIFTALKNHSVLLALLHVLRDSLEWSLSLFLSFREIAEDGLHRVAYAHDSALDKNTITSRNGNLYIRVYAKMHAR